MDEKLRRTEQNKAWTNHGLGPTKHKLPESGQSWTKSNQVISWTKLSWTEQGQTKTNSGWVKIEPNQIWLNKMKLGVDQAMTNQTKHGQIGPSRAETSLVNPTTSATPRE